MVKYYFAGFNEMYEEFRKVRSATSLDSARKSLVGSMKRNMDSAGAIATNPDFFVDFDGGESGKKYLVGEVYLLADVHDPYCFHWYAKGKRNGVPIKKDGSI